jgi:tRNA 2-thiouridine synthesizing protein A
MTGDPEIDMDLTGLLCPLPVLKARKRLQDMASGQVLRILASDPMAAIDIPHFCTEQGHTLLSAERDGTSNIFRIARK